jgi:subtilisin family serine protease
MMWPGARRPIAAKRARSRWGSLEALEQRQLLSVSPIDPQPSFTSPVKGTDEITALNWNGSNVLAYRGEWIVGWNDLSGAPSERLETGQSRLNAALAAIQGGTAITEQAVIVRELGLAGVYLVDAPDSLDGTIFSSTLSQSPGFRFMEPNFAVWASATIPNDARFGELWGLHNTGQSGGTADADIDAPEAWDLATGNTSVVVGIIDTGIDYTHPDLVANIWTNPGEIAGDSIDNDGNGFIDDIHGWDFANDDSDPFDDNSHGTHVAGTIGGVGNNGTGVVGVNWSVELMGLKFLRADGFGSTADAVDALNYATMMRRDFNQNVRVTNNSWGGGGFSAAMELAIQSSRDADMLFIAAAGNANSNNDVIANYPSNYDVDNVIAVAATDRNDLRADFSSYGATTVDLGAPGVAILSTTPNNTYSFFNGTSMATPHVVGVAALAWSVNPGATYAQIRDAILGGVDPVASMAGITVTGGRLNARHTLELLGLLVASSTPSAGEIVAAPPVDFTIRFSESYDPLSVQVDDFLVDGLPADSVTLFDTNTLIFHYNVSPATAQGAHVMNMAQNSVVRTSDGIGLAQWSGTFRYDALRLEVTSTSPANGSTAQLPLTSVTLVFNELIDPSSINLNDLLINQGTVVGMAAGADSATFTLSGILQERTLTLTVPAGAITDQFGNPNLAYSGSLEVDINEVPYPTPLEAIEPLGSLIYDPEVVAEIGLPGDVDRFSLSLDPGRLTVVVLAQNGLIAAIDLEDEQGTVLASATAGGVGQPAVLSSYLIGGGTYKIAVRGQAGTTGGYRVRAIVNAAVELESHQGSTNDSRGSAQDLNGAAVFGPGGSSLLSVLGSLSGGGAIDEEFEPNDDGIPGGSLADLEAANDWTSSFTPFGPGARQAVLTGTIDAGNDGDWDFFRILAGPGNLLIANMLGNTLSDPLVRLYDKFGNQLEFDDNGTGNLDAIINFSAFTYTGEYYVVADSAGSAIGSYELIAFIVGGPVVPPGASDTADYYSFSLSAGEAAGAYLKTLVGRRVEVELQDASGAVLAQGFVDADNVDSAIGGFKAPATGTYFAVVRGTARADYSLLVARQMAFDLEPNSEQATAQDITASNGTVLGYLEGGTGGLYAVEWADATTTRILELDPATGQILSSITSPIGTPTNPFGLNLAFDGTSLWYNTGAFFGSNTIYQVDPATGSVLNSFFANQSGAPFGLGYVGGELFVSDSGGIDVYRLSDFAYMRTLPLPAEVSLPFEGLAGDDEHGVLYAISQSTRRLYRLDPSSGAVLADSAGITVGNEQGMAVAGEEIFVSHTSGIGGTNELAVYDRQTLQLLREMPLAVATMVAGLGGDGVAQGSGDWYRISVQVGDPLLISTQTPGGEPGFPLEFRNALDPQIELYDAAGNLLASDDNGGNDGKNSAVVFHALSSGSYFVRVLSANDERGEYVLSVQGASGSVSPFVVTSIVPEDGAHLSTAPTTIRVDFSEGILLTSLTPSDLLIDGIAATGMTIVDGNTVVFDVPALANGLHSVVILAGSVSSTAGTPLSGFDSTFEIDVTAPYLISSSIQPGDVLSPGTVTFTAVFSEALRSDQIDGSDFLLVGTLSGNTYVANEMQYDSQTSILSVTFFNIPEDHYTLTLVSGDGHLEDWVGNDLDGEPLAFPLPPNVSGDGLPGGNFFVSFDVDAPDSAYPTLTPKGPLGSQIYDPTVEGTLSLNDVDTYTINIDAGQNLSVLVESIDAVSVQVRILDPALQEIASANGSAAQDALINSQPIVTGGVYRIELSALAGTSGRFRLQVVLNAALELEQHTSQTNNDLATAQELESAFRDLGAGAAIAGVLGRGGSRSAISDGYGYEALSVPFEFQDISITGSRRLTGVDDSFTELTAADLNGFSFNFYGTTYNNLFFSSNGLVTFGGGQYEYTNGPLFDDPFFPTIAAYWDDLVTFTYPDSGVYWQVVGAGDQQELIVQWNRVQFFSGPTGDALTFQVVLSEATGRMQVNYQNLSSSDIRAEGAGATLGIKNGGSQGSERLLVAYNQGPNEFIGSNRSTLIGVGISAPPVDYYHVSLAAGESLSAAIIANGEVEISLLDEFGATLTTGQTNGPNVSEYISRFTSLTGGDYYISVQGREIDYNLVALRNAAFDHGPNDNFTDAQMLGATAAVAGYAHENGDWYAFSVQAGDALELTTTTPGDAPGEFGNGLDPSLTLYDPAGNLVAFNADSAPDGRNALLTHLAQSTGLYRVFLRAHGAPGEYVLHIDGATGADPAPMVLSSLPGDGASVLSATTVTLVLSEGLRLDSIDAGDLLVGGLPAINVTVLSGNVLEFTIDPAALVGDGLYNVSLAAGGVLDLQGNSNVAYNGTFKIDTTGPRVVSWDASTAPDGTVTFTATFDEPVSSIGAAAVQLRDTLRGVLHSPSSVVLSNSNQVLTVTYQSLPESIYEVTLRSGDGEIEDSIGNDLDGEPNALPSGDGVPGGDFSAQFFVDQPVQSLDGTWQRLQPLGSLIFTTADEGVITHAGDVDSFEFDLEANQAITLAVLSVDHAGWLQIELIDPNSNVVAAAAANSPGEPVVLQNLSVLLTGRYRVNISGSIAASYRLELYRNAAREVFDTTEVSPQALALSPLAIGWAVAGTSDLTEVVVETFDVPAPRGAYVRSNIALPWGSATNEIAMDRVFGAGNWGDFRFEDVNVSDLLGNYDFLFLEGSDSLAIALETFLTANLGQLEAFVAAGNTIFLNAAPNIGDGMSFGFGGVQLVYSDFSGPGTASDGSHPIFVGPSTPVGTSFSGNWFSHASVHGGGITPLILDDTGDATLAELAWGSGIVLFGGMTTDNFHLPQPEASNLRANIIAYAAAGSRQLAPDVDMYQVDLSSAVGTRVDIVLAGRDGLNFSEDGLLELLAADGQTVLAMATASHDGVDLGNFDLGILGFEVPGPGQYYVRFRGDIQGNYQLLVTAGQTFDTEPNDLPIDPTRDLAPAGAVGHLDASPRSPSGSISLDIDASLSTLAFGGGLVDESGNFLAPLVPQAPGSELAHFDGLIQATLAPGSIQFLGNSDIDGVEKPGAFLPGNAPADVAVKVGLLPGVDGFAAIRGAVLDVTSGQILVGPDGSFSASQLAFSMTAGIFEYSIPALGLSGSDFLDGLELVNQTLQSATIQEVGGQFVVNIPVEGSVDLEEPTSGLIIRVLLSGQLVATVSAATQVDPGDVYEVQLQAGDSLTLSTSTPLDGLAGTNTLDPSLAIEAADGTSLAFDSNSQDGRNARLVFVATQAGTYRIVVRAESGTGEYILHRSTTTDAPVVDISGSDSAVRGQSRRFYFEANDLPEDELAGFHWTIDWEGDGIIDEEFDAGSTFDLEHVFTATGNYQIRATATDQAGNASPAATHSVEVTAYALQADPENPSLTNLVWGGTTGRDYAFVLPVFNAPNGVMIYSMMLNSVMVNQNKSFHGVTGKVIMFGQDDNDVLIGEFAQIELEMSGGEGDDVLVGGFRRDKLMGDGGNDILLGSARHGDRGDTLLGGEGDDLLIGMQAADVLHGDEGEDLIVAGGILFNDLPTAIIAIQQEWSSDREFDTRVDNISGNGSGPRSNGNYFLTPGATVLDDHQVDSLLGGTERDWLFFDFVEDQLGDEEVDDLLVDDGP